MIRDGTALAGVPADATVPGVSTGARGAPDRVLTS